jgi:iron complex transport system permease protein
MRNRRRNARQRLILAALAAALPLSMALSSGLGAYPVGFDAMLAKAAGFFGGAPRALTEELHRQTEVWWVIRVPRVLGCAVVGAGLALGGAVMQGLFRNPLADPSLIGVSAGAGATAAACIVLFGGLQVAFAGLEWSVLPLAAFGGALGTSLLIYRLSQSQGRTQVTTLLLSGMAVNALSGAVIGMFIFLSDDDQLRDLNFWMLGSLGGTTWRAAGVLAGLAAAAHVFLLPLHKPLNALSLGERESAMLGVHTERLKRRIFLFTALAVGGSVAFCGIIGFVGLVTPHILRLLGGGDHRYLLPAAALGGAVLLCWADTLARTLVQPSEMPLGVITSIAGTPFFLLLLQKRKTAA